MSSLFISIANISITASWIILAVLALRLLLRKAPGWFRMLSWALVGIRLILPFSIESKLSLLPSADPIGSEIMLTRSPGIYSGISVIDNAVNPLIQQAFTPDPATSMNPLQFWIPFAAVLWLIGTAVMIGYMLISYYRLRRSVSDAVLEADGCYVSEKVTSPFVLGIRKPKIFLPPNMWDSEKEHVLAHEQAHIHRKDHWWKPLGFVILSIHWFNPLVWLAYVLFCRDLEFACDEAVIKALEASERADYSQVLLNCCTERNRISACPLAFGEVGVKERIKSVLSYKKPAVWIIGAAAIAVAVTCVCLLTNPAKVTPTSPIGEDIKNPDYVFAWGGLSASPDAVDSDAKEAIIPMIFDHKYTLLGETLPLDLSSADSLEEKTQMYFDYLRSIPGGKTLDESDYKNAIHIEFSYGPTEESWTFYESCIKRDVIKSGSSVVTYWYRLDIPLWLQVLDWYEDMVVPSPEDLINRTY